MTMPKITDPIFNIEYQYKLYLERVKLNENIIPEVQKIETKRAFMAGMAQMLFLLRDDVSLLEDEVAVDMLENLKNQVGKFWNNQTRGDN